MAVRRRKTRIEIRARVMRAEFARDMVTVWQDTQGARHKKI